MRLPYRFMENIHPDDREMVREAVTQSIDNQSFLRVEYRVQKLDGGTRWILASGRPDQVTKGAPARLMGVSLDITKRKEMEIRLRENEERLSLAFSATQDGIWDWNIETDEVLYSPRWKSMLGYGDDEVEPLTDWQQLVHPDDLERVRAALRDHLAGVEPLFESVHRLRHRDGVYLWVVSRAKALSMRK